MEKLDDLSERMEELDDLLAEIEASTARMAALRRQRAIVAWIFVLCILGLLIMTVIR